MAGTRKDTYKITNWSKYNDALLQRGSITVSFRQAYVNHFEGCGIVTCQHRVPSRLCGANPFQYLSEVERHADELSSNPDRRMPWNYQETLAAAPTTPAAC